MPGLLREIFPSMIGAFIGVYIAQLLGFGRRKGWQPVPESILAVWRTANSMPDGLCQVRIMAGGPNKILDIKAIRKACPQLGLRGAKYLVDHLPELVAAGFTPEAADAFRQNLEATGMVLQVERRSVTQLS